MNNSSSDVHISVVLPSYSEAENLEILLPELKKVLGGLALSYEVIVVDTQVPLDHTSSICQSNGVRYLNRTPDNSYASAVRSGIEAVKGEFTIFMDADGSHPPAFLENLWKHHQGNDLVIASRYIKGGKTDNPALLVFMSKLVNLVFSFVLGLKVHDVSNSLKLYKSEQLKSLHLVCRNLDVIEEILFKLIKNNKDFKIKELPFSFKKRMHGASKRSMLAFIWSYITTLIKLRFGLLK